MNPGHIREPYEEEREELQFELLGKNAFRAVVVYAVGFVVACAWVFAQGGV